MNRAMFSGVAGLKAHQSKMDVIGNNIANVNTFGYKSQRAVFSDIYYQQVRAASEGNANRGGTNPSSIGYGSGLTAVQANMGTSSMQNTGFGLDVAITGDGFLQVMDADGNIFYTKAGMLDYDSNGYLTDVNGNFVLGTTTPDGAPASQKIKLDNIPGVDASTAQTEIKINDVVYNLTASNAAAAANVSLSITSSDNLPVGQKAVANISTSGAIVVTLNANEQFSDMTELNKVINAAITSANGGKDIPAGTLTLTPSQNVFGTDAIAGTFTGLAKNEDGKFTGTGVNPLTGNISLFGGVADITGWDMKGWPAIDDTITFSTAVEGTDKVKVTVTVKVNGVDKTFEGIVPQNAATNTAFDLTNADGGKISLKLNEAGSKLLDVDPVTSALTGKTDTTITAHNPEKFLGGAAITTMGTNFSESGDIDFTIGTVGTDEFELVATVNGRVYKGQVKTAGGSVVLKQDPAVNGDDITLNVPSFAEMKKNLGLADAATINDLTTALNSTVGYHDYKARKAVAADTSPLTGAQIAGKNEGVEKGNLDFGAAKLFDGAMTFKQAGTGFSASGLMTFSAKYTAATTTAKAFWTVTGKSADGKEYTATISEDTVGTSILLKNNNSDSDYLEMTNPGFAAITQAYRNGNAGGDPVPGMAWTGCVSGGAITATPSAPSRNLGLGSVVFNLTGGTEGGTVTLDQLTNITIASDGTITVSHPDKGTVTVGKISLANFANTSGLELEGNNYYSASANSGDPVLCDPGTKGTGALKNNSLEMSNVDLSAEFADMITTQRGFQANSRIITVSDTMLEELINLKR